ncbi:hypothetical protein BSL78_08151 [Apostichopus japonicus]|uniref:Uncharacterized protein n=1 Tax=Stichopus japonicus TaxID=307972 RepID=A0A2G8L3X0_STIJA|nr:hypothetical protein BSL78_08151 [Apostichopus japonicus]
MDNFQKKQMMAGMSELTDTVCLWYSDVPKRLPAIVLLLSQQGFPNATRVVLNWLGNYFEHCRNYQTGKFPNKQQLLFLIDSFIFFKTDQVQVQLTLTRELHLLEEICKHFQRQASSSSKFLTFEALFGGRTIPSDNVEEHRQKILHKTVSMALSLQCQEVLECAAVWLHTQNLSPCAMGLVDSILMDFCDLLPNTSHALERLPEVCPQFLNQLLPCVFSYLCVQGYKDEEFEPWTSIFLKISANWLSKNPNVCLLHATNPFPQNATFHKVSKEKSVRRGSSWSPSPLYVMHPLWNLKSSRENHKEETLVVSKLFYYLIQAITATPQIERDGDKVYVIPRQDILNVVTEMKRKLKTIVSSATAVEMSLDRLAEAVQIGNAAKQLEISSGEIEDFCEGLPPSHLLDIVLHSRHE